MVNLSAKYELLWASKASFMVNYRVDDLEGLLEELRPVYVLVADRKIGVERNPDLHEQGARK